MERIGADDVVAMDIPDAEPLDAPIPPERKGDRPFQQKRENFEIVKGALGSKVRRELLSVYDVTPDRLGMFDYVFVGSVLVHLRDPVRALMALRTVCRGQIHLCEATHRGLDWLARGAAAKFEALSPHLTWWIPNRRCLADWLRAADYGEVRHGHTFVLPFTQLRGGVRHSVVWGTAT
jgi:tRNA (mo5U34)-methyltransferase